MKIEQQLLDKVESKLNKQNALYAALGASLWSVPLIALWYFIYTYSPNFGSIMMLVNGFLIGLIIRIHGRGMTKLFSLLALLSHTWIVVVALGLDIVISGTSSGIFLFGLYAAGAGVSMHIAKNGVPFEEHRAYDYLTSMNKHSSNTKIKNRWFIAVPILVLTMLISTSLTTVGIVFYNEYYEQSKQLALDNKVTNKIKNKEIDITPSSLERRTTKEILLYSYAYNSGLLFNHQGNISTQFSLSEYKSQTILKYLINHRDNARAKFILGLLQGTTDGLPLLEEAANQGDEYAKIYSAINYGCYTNSDIAIQKLKVLRQSYRDKYLHEEIDSIIYIGFNDICSDIEDPQYLLSFAVNYYEQPKK